MCADPSPQPWSASRPKPSRGGGEESRLPSAAAPAAAQARRAEALGARLPPLLVAAERVAATVAQGVHGRRRVGQGDSFWQFRPFVVGDTIARIDWRQSAKSGRPAPHGWFVRETEWEAAQTVCLWRDSSPSMRWHSRMVPTEKARTRRPAAAGARRPAAARRRAGDADRPGRAPCRRPRRPGPARRPRWTGGPTPTSACRHASNCRATPVWC